MFFPEKKKTTIPEGCILIRQYAETFEDAIKIFKGEKRPTMNSLTELNTGERLQILQSIEVKLPKDKKEAALKELATWVVKNPQKLELAKPLNKRAMSILGINHPDDLKPNVTESNNPSKADMTLVLESLREGDERRP